MEVAEVHEQQPRPTVSPDEILSKARSRVSKLEAAIQMLDGEDPALAGLQEALLKAKNPAKVPSLKDQVASNRALHHPREEESRRCQSQSGRCRCGPRQVAQRIGGWREECCTVARRVEQVDNVRPHGARSEFPNSSRRGVRAGASPISGGRTHRRECVAQFDARQSHRSWVGVASSPGGVARVAAGAGRVEKCVCQRQQISSQPRKQTS